MKRFGKTAARTLSALLVLGVCGMGSGVASAQSAQSDPGNSGSAQPRGNGNKATSQEQFDREKLALKAQIQEQIDAANANVDALKKMSQNDKGPTKKQHDDMQKQLSDTRDRLQNDLDKIDRASTSDWNGLRPAVEHDLTTMHGQLQRVAAITKVPPPQTGSANKQPQK
jgi:Skp family chaperone for outer membrane proteins